MRIIFRAIIAFIASLFLTNWIIDDIIVAYQFTQKMYAFVGAMILANTAAIYLALQIIYDKRQDKKARKQAEARYVRRTNPNECKETIK